MYYKLSNFTAMSPTFLCGRKNINEHLRSAGLRNVVVSPKAVVNYAADDVSRKSP